MFGTITANIGGRVRTLKFNLNANYEFCKMHNLTQDEVMTYFTDAHNVDAIRDMIYCALKAADLADGRAVDYNPYKVGEWIQEMDQKELERVITGAEDSNPEPDKKKAAKDDA